MASKGRLVEIHLNVNKMFIWRGVVVSNWRFQPERLWISNLSPCYAKPSIHENVRVYRLLTGRIYKTNPAKGCSSKDGPRFRPFRKGEGLWWCCLVGYARPCWLFIQITTQCINRFTPCLWSCSCFYCYPHPLTPQRLPRSHQLSIRFGCCLYRRYQLLGFVPATFHLASVKAYASSPGSIVVICHRLHLNRRHLDLDLSTSAFVQSSSCRQNLESDKKRSFGGKCELPQTWCAQSMTRTHYAGARVTLPSVFV